MYDPRIQYVKPLRSSATRYSGLHVGSPAHGLVAGGGVSAGGPQAAVAIRPRVVIKRKVAVSIDVGGSLGPHKKVEEHFFYIDGPSDPEYTRTWDVAYWLNLDAGAELPISNNGVIRIYGGMAKLMNPDAFTCSGPALAVCESPAWAPGPYLPYVGTEIMFGF